MKRICVLMNFILAFLLLNIPVGAAIEPQLDANQKAIQNAVIIDTKASVILVNGAKRYIDLDDPQRKPDVINGSLYLPVHTLARALGYYYEARPENAYYLLRRQETEFRFDGGEAYRREGRRDAEKLSNCMVYRNGEALLPIRLLAEAAGKTVAWRDGIAAISDTDPVGDILDNAAVSAYISAELAAFREKGSTGRVYYVAQTENAADENDGSKEYPFRTLNRAGQAAGPGDTVIVREGVYRETFQPAQSGTAAAPVIYRAYAGEKVVISAAEPLSGFQSAADGLVKAKLPVDLGLGRNQVFYRGTALAEGRYPNGPGIKLSPAGAPLSPLFPTAGQFQASIDDPYRIESGSLLNQPEGWWDGAIYVGMQGTGWVLSTGRVKTSAPGSLEIFDTPEQWWFGGLVHEKMSFGFLTGHMHCIDQPGEWAVQDGELYILPPEGENGSGLEVEVKARQLAVDLSGKSYIQLKGIDTFGGGICMKDSVMCVIDGAHMQYISHYIHGYDQREGYIDDGNIQNENGAPPRGEMGIYLGGENNVIVNSVIDHSAAAGIYSTGLYAYIENNIIKNCGYAGGYVSGITFGTEGWKSQTTPRGGFSLYHNTVYNCGRSALNMQGRQYWENGSDTPYLPFEAAYNDFHDGVLFSLDTGIVYEYYVHAGSETLNSSFHNNYVYYTSAVSNPYSFGIYHDGNTSGIDTYENLVFTTQPGVKFSDGYIYKQPAADCAVWNNMEIKSGIEGGRAGLEASDFPGGRPFFAGAYLQSGDYAAYYAAFMEGYTPPAYYSAADADMNNASLDGDGLAVVGTGGWIRWDAVDFGTDGNRIDINFKGDAARTGDRVSMIIGEHMDTGKRYNAVLNAGAPELGQNNIVSIDTREFSGTQTVYLRVDRNVSARIDGISVSNRGAAAGAHDGALVYGGEFDNVEVIGNASYPPAPIYSVAAKTERPMVKNTYGGTVLRYDDVAVKQEAKTLAVCAASAGDSSGGTVKIRIGSRTAEPVAAYTVPDSGWDTYIPEEIPLNSALEAGVYDIYVTFEGEGKTSNFYTFGFLPDEAGL